MARDWDGNGWAPRRSSCSCAVVYAHASGVCPNCGGEVPTFEFERGDI